MAAAFDTFRLSNPPGMGILASVSQFPATRRRMPAPSGLSTTTATRFSVSSVVVDVPEPATWSLMILGVGLAGLGLRRRREVVAA